jgi:hypothetical protein
MYGPFEVEVIGKNGCYCTIKLPDFGKIHPMFNITLLERGRGTDSVKQVVKIQAEDSGWTMESIIASAYSDHDPRKHAYLVKLEGYSHDGNTWETYENVLECSFDLLREHSSKNPATEKDRHFGKKKR